MSLCFFVKDHQDLDHLTPIIKFLKNNYNILILLEDEKLIDDNRLKFISNFSEIKLIKKQNFFLKYIKIKIFNSNFLSKTLFFIINILSKIKIFRLLFNNHILIKKKIKGIVYDHRPPHECDYIFICKLFKIKIFSYPHGYHIFTDEIDFAENQANRNVFDSYITQVEFQKKNLISLGISQDKILILGSPRFEKNWILDLENIYRKLENFFSEKKPIISIFLGHWKYGINKDETINMINAIISLNKYNIILNLHTRGTSKLNLDEINYYKNKKNIFINDNNYYSSQIIDLSKVIIGVGTSILLECITRGKIFYYLKYLQSYQTIFNKMNNDQLVKSTDELIKKLENLRAEPIVYLNHESTFYNKYIMNNFLDLKLEHINFFKKELNNLSE